HGRGLSASRGYGRQPECKTRAASQRALHRQVTAHHHRQLAADGKAEPGAAGLASVAILDLNEWLENPREIIRRNPDPGIVDGDPDSLRVCGRLPRPPADSPLDSNPPAARGELHRVPEEIGDDLFDAMWITEIDRRVGRSWRRDVEVFRRCLWPHVQDRALDRLVASRRDPSYGHLARFDLRQVE